MKRNMHIAMISILLLLTMAIGTEASVDVTITPDESTLGPLVNFVDKSQYEKDIATHPQSFFDLNDKAIPYGFALANTLGYPNGKSLIKQFPSFEFGLSGGASVYKSNRSSDFGKDNPSIPGIGANASIHFGTGIDPKSDITFKLLYSQNFYTPDKTVKKDNSKRDYELSMTRVDILSVGSKIRYNIIPQQTAAPFLFSFGGITGGIALDYMKGKIEAEGTYRDRRNINFSVSDPITFETITRSVSMESTIKGKTSLEWNIISVSPEIFAYLDLLYALSLYTGPSVSLNAGSVKFKANANGSARNVNAIYSDGNIVELVPANSVIATAEMKSDTKMKVPLAIPKWTLGLEINILAFKIQVEGTTVLTSPRDSYAGQVGIRVQF